MAVEALRLLNQTLERRVAQSTADRNRMWTLSTDVMMVAGLDGTISSINPAWTQLAGLEGSRNCSAPTCSTSSFPRAARSCSRSSTPCRAARRRTDRAQHADGATAQAAASNGARWRPTISCRRSAATSPPSARRRTALAQGRGGAAPFAEDGGDRPAHRRHRARLQQHADGHHRLDGGAEAPHPRRPLRRRAELHGRRHRRGQPRGRPDASAAGVCPPPAARPQGGRRQSADPRHGGPAGPDPGRKDQARDRPGARDLARR